MSMPDDTHLTPVTPTDSALAQAGQAANTHAARSVFADYLSRKADNTLRRQAADLARFAEFLRQVGELARPQVSDIDLKAGEMRFLRPKVDKVQTHKLSADTLRALHAWLESGDAPGTGCLLQGSRKGGRLTNSGISEQSITERVRVLGEQVGLTGLSAHDCRHYWATYWARKVDVLRLQEAGGWSSLAMPRRYVEDSEIANEGMA